LKWGRGKNYRKERSKKGENEEEVNGERKKRNLERRKWK
jgi:hypothetical protein